MMTGGMDNPVDVVFTPGGERILTTTFLRQPGGGRRDGLIHAVHGGVYGKVHDAIERVETDEVPEEMVYDEVQRGYLLGGKVFRPALVRVAKAPAERAL